MSGGNSGNSHFANTFSSMAYEQLTGMKAPPPNSSSSSVFSNVTSPSNSGTGRWAAGLGNAGSFLDNLGTGGSALDGPARNTTWDIPYSGSQISSYSTSKENVPEYRPRSHSKKRDGGVSVSSSALRSSTDRKSNSSNHYRGSSESADLNNYSSSIINNKKKESNNYYEDHREDLQTNLYRCDSKSYSSVLTSPLVPMKSAEFGSRGGGMSGVLDQKRHSQDNILNSKTVNNKSSSTYDSRSSTPSSNSNSLTKKKKTNVVDEVLDDSSITNTSPYFHLTKNGIDQLEVLSDSGGSLSPDTIPDHEIEGLEEHMALDVGSMVEIVIRGLPRCGVIRWLGPVPGDKREGRIVAGIELEDGSDGLSDGTFDGLRHFTCPPGKAIFVNLSMCRQDRRFLESLGSSNSRASIAFGSPDCGPVSGRVAPPEGASVKDMMGTNKGIQGHQNSCYLDATLFSMFAFTSAFDSLLFRPATPSDIAEYSEVQEVLRDGIVNPLRSRMFVRADRVMKLRQMLDSLSSVSGLTTEEKDPEEFLHCLLAQILKAEPYLQLSSGQDAYHYQLFLDKDDKVGTPSVQHLFDQSFLTSDIKLKQVPPILILQMPRFGKDYKMFPRILPSLILDVTDVIEDSPRQCIICGQVAEFECAQCFGQCGSGLESIAFCTKCIDKVHTHKKRDSHSSVHRLRVPQEYQMLADHCTSVPRVYMELFAVVCIETSHYVTFTRCGEGPDATWCFFDSMADRKGEQNGYNIPSVVKCEELLDWLGEQGTQALNALPDDKALPDLTRRLLCDAYMCFYQSSKVAMYR